LKSASQGARRPPHGVFLEAIADDGKAKTAAAQIGNDCHDVCVYSGIRGGLLPNALFGYSLNSGRIYSAGQRSGNLHQRVYERKLPQNNARSPRLPFGTKRLVVKSQCFAEL
jgi:hypothetical protein